MAAEQFEYEISETIRAHAMSFPETAEGASCVNRAFNSGGKNFVFLGEQTGLCTMRLKTAAGWQKLEFAPDAAPPADELRDQITESFFLLAPKRIQKLVDAD